MADHWSNFRWGCFTLASFLPDAAIRTIVPLFFWTKYRNVTDRRTKLL